MKYRPKIGHGDFDTKTRKVEEFLGEGHKVKVTIMFRGREMQHPELGRKILNQVAEAVVHVGAVEVYPKQDGRNMIMVLGPDKKAQIQIKKPRPDASTTPPAAPDASTTPSAATNADVSPAASPAPVAEVATASTPVPTPQDAS
jgi:translation initiation factor IF-3